MVEPPVGISIIELGRKDRLVRELQPQGNHDYGRQFRNRIPAIPHAGRRPVRAVAAGRGAAAAKPAPGKAKPAPAGAAARPGRAPARVALNAQVNASAARVTGAAGVQREVVIAPEHWTVGDAIDYLRAAENLPDQFYHVILIDPRMMPVGYVTLGRLLSSKRDVRLRDIVEDSFRTIEVTEQQHQNIKALAALQGKSIKEFALQRLFAATPDEEQAMQQLKTPWA